MKWLNSRRMKYRKKNYNQDRDNQKTGSTSISRQVEGQKIEKIFQTSSSSSSSSLKKSQNF